MRQPIADIFVGVLTKGDSLRRWETSGLLEREWAMLGWIAEHYGRVILVSHGDETDLEIAQRLPGSPDVVCLGDQAITRTDSATAVDRILNVIRAQNPGSCVIRTDRMDDDGIADELLFELREHGVETALIARGGYLRSRFVAKTHGPASREAIEAGRDEERLCAAADLVVGTTGVMIDELAWRFGLGAEHTRIIPNYVIDTIAPGVSEDRDETRILCAGHLIPRKQIELIIQGVSALPESMRTGLVLEIVGQGPERDTLGELAESLGISVEMPGALPHTELVERMRHCAVFCQASAFEGHPKTVLEAMSVGCAVVVASTPGLGGIVQNGITGLVVPPKPESFTFAISGLLEDPFLRTTLGGAARDHARDRYGLKRIAKLELDAHRDALALSRLHGRDRLRRQTVRWQSPLLHAGDHAQLGAWTRSIDAFVERLHDDEQQPFLAALLDAVRDLRDETRPGQQAGEAA